jgi:hypothetical protein
MMEQQTELLWREVIILFARLYFSLTCGHCIVWTLVWIRTEINQAKAAWYLAPLGFYQLVPR